MTSLQPGRRDLIDATVGDEVPRVVYMAELGASGLRRNSGYLDDEFLPALRGRKAVKIYREISDNSPVIGGWFAAVSQLLRQIEWRVEPANSSAAAKKGGKHVEECMDDMEHSFGDMITEMASFVIYGWHLAEMNFKRRKGPETKGIHHSKFNDEKIGWLSIAGRSQETIIRWVFGPKGEILGAVQQAPPRYERKVLPMDKMMLFRTTTARNSPEGRSLLRNVYEPWYYLKRHQEIEAVGVARDLAGLPLAKVPSKILSAKPGTPDGMMLDAIKRLVTSVSRNENEGVVWPHDVDPDTKLPNYDFSLLTSGGSRQFDTESIINRYKTEMLQAVLADFLQVGHEDNGGSYALHTDKTGLFRTCINALAQMIADVFNRKAIPLLFRLNGWPVNELPTIVPNSVDPPDLTQLASFLSATGALGVQWFPDPELEKFLRDAAGIPKLDTAEENQLETQRRQSIVLALATQRMQALQLDQQVQQGQMGIEQQRQQLEAGAQGADKPDPGDPDGKHAQAQAGEATAQSKFGTQAAKVKVAQERQKLANLKKKPAEKKPIKKAYVMRVRS